MRNVYLLTCSHRKLSEPARAKDLYISPSFIAARKIAEKKGDNWFILSAKHGLIEPEVKLKPYDLSLLSLSESEREKWASTVINDLSNNLQLTDKIIILGDDLYASYISDKLRLRGFEVYCPLLGKTNDEKLHWLNAYGEGTPRLADLNTFYSLLSELSDGLGGLQSLKDFTPESSFPKRGVYFFFENGENRYNSHSTLRVVRVGTHAISNNSKSTLWQRLRTHRGTQEGIGNHRSSIMRLYVGAALIEKSKGGLSVPSWGIGQSASKHVREMEIHLEREVSEYIGKMKILWISVNDPTSSESDRAYIERNAIALLAGRNGPLDLPSNDWLGKFCPNTTVRNSGLWNVDFITEFYDNKFLNVFSQYVDISIGKKKYPTNSIAPKEWFKRKITEKDPTQMELFKG